MKAILHILLLFALFAAADANAQSPMPVQGGAPGKKSEQNIKAARGTYVILFREDHKQVIDVSDDLLRRVEQVRSSDPVYLRVSENILVKVLPEAEAAPPVGDDDFIYIPGTDFDLLLQQSIL
jgi:hypothetical protein